MEQREITQQLSESIEKDARFSQFLEVPVDIPETFRSPDSSLSPHAGTKFDSNRVNRSTSGGKKGLKPDLWHGISAPVPWFNPSAYSRQPSLLEKAADAGARSPQLGG